MASTDISKYHGRVTKCHCGIADHPEGNSERACKQCFGRGFLAECLACDGKGQTMQAMAGGPGTHTATCNCCGGVGNFGVNRPADWVEEVKAEPETAVA